MRRGNVLMNVRGNDAREQSACSMTRRQLLQGSVAALIAASVASDGLALEEKQPLIDTHTHFYDPTRAEGVPWPGKDDKKLYRPILPAEFVKLGKKHGVTKTVVVEASPWRKDNEWLLALADKESSIVGVVGNLDPADDNFARDVKQLAQQPKYRGVRLSGDRIEKLLGSEKQLDALKALEEAGLTLDLNAGSAFVQAVQLAKRFPKLRIVINHMGNVAIDGKQPPRDWEESLAPAADMPLVWCKLSAVVEGSRKNDGTAPTDLNFYRPTLEALWKAFGREKLTYGSNWPVSDLFATYDTVFTLASTFVKEQEKAAIADVFRGNAVRAYGLNV